MKKQFAFLVFLTIFAGLAQGYCRSDVVNRTPDSRYTVHDDGTVTDTATGLMWQQCAEGLSGKTCNEGAALTMSWEAALTRAQTSEFATYLDWRVPNAKELFTLVALNCAEPAINEVIFPNTPYLGLRYWTSTPVNNAASLTWLIAFFDGSLLFQQQRNVSNQVVLRLVRDAN